MTTTEAQQQPSFLARVSQYPLVGSLTSVYDMTKSYVPLVDRAEGMLLATAQPLVAGRSESLNKFACEQLDRLEAVAARPVAQSQRLAHNVIQTTVVLQGVPRRVISTASSSAHRTLLQAESTVASLTDRVVDVADWGVDLLLPPSSPSEEQWVSLEFKEEAEQQMMEQQQQQQQQKQHIPSYAAVASEREHPSNPEQQLSRPEPPRRLGHEASRTLQHVRQTVSKAQARALQHALRNLHVARMRSQDTIEAMRPFTVDLIAYACNSVITPLASAAAKLDTEERASTTHPAVAPGYLAARASELRQLLAARMADIRAMASERFGYLVVRTQHLNQRVLDTATTTIHHYPRLESALEAMSKVPGVQTAWLVMTHWLPTPQASGALKNVPERIELQKRIPQPVSTTPIPTGSQIAAEPTSEPTIEIASEPTIEPTRESEAAST